MKIACQGKQNEQFFLPFPLLSSSDLCLLTHEGFVVTFHTLAWRLKKKKKNGTKRQSVGRGGTTDHIIVLANAFAGGAAEETQLSNVIKTRSQLAIFVHTLTCILSGWC